MRGANITMGEASSDEFDQYNLSDFNDEDFGAVDAVVLSLSPTPDLGASTSASPRLEASADTSLKTTRQYSTKAKGRKRRKRRKTDESVDESGASPFARYRERRGTLSVSDLVGPSWCEVQFDYGLRQGRSKKLSERSPSFVTAAGKTITVERSVAKRNDTTQRRGTAIHKKLERELRPEEMEVTVDTEAERWALKLIQLNACLDDLLIHGFCREMPVFGILQDKIVTGIIDEITSCSLQDTTESSSSAKKPLSANVKSQQTSLTTFFAGVSHPLAPAHELRISDSKTRRAPGLPSDEDSQPARLQLMLYHRLLAQLLDSHFEWAAFWKRVGVDASAPLSDKFLKQTFLIQSNTETPNEYDASSSVKDRREDIYVGFPRTLDDLVDALRPTADAVTGSSSNISDTLEIVYRAQRAYRSTRSSRRAQEQAEAGLREPRENEDLEMQRAIAASLAEYAGSPNAPGMGASIDSVMPSLDTMMPPFGGTSFGRIARTSDTSARTSSHLGRTLDSALGEMAWAAQEAAISRSGDAQVGALSQAREAEDEGARAVDYLRASSAEEGGEARSKPLLGRAAETRDGESEDSDDEVIEEDAGGRSGRIIGRRVFKMNDSELDAHLARVLGWWMGEREPEGVPVELSRRCFSCEYRDGCEWREAKARDIAERFGVINEEGSYELGSDGKSDEESEGTDSSLRRKGGVDVVASMF